MREILYDSEKKNGELYKKRETNMKRHRDREDKTFHPRSIQSVLEKGK